jgi:SAM-dependent methyltransferase
MTLYDDEAQYYDALYYWKDYEGEVARLVDVIRARKSDARTLLDVGCGTGMHLALLGDHLDVAGVDLNEAMLRIARERLPGVPLHEGDMRNFDLGSRFDAITCLFSGIGYMPDVAALDAAVANMARHLSDDGVLIIEPWLEPAQFTSGHLGALLADQPDFKLARMNITSRQGNRSRLEFLYALASPDGLKSWESTEEVTLFERSEMTGAFEKAGLSVEHDPEGLMGRGLYIAQGPA